MTKPSMKTSDATSIVPGGTATSTTLIPEGESYAALYIVDAAGEEILARYCSFSFRATMIDGTNLMYYVVPVANGELVSTALNESGILYTPYEQENAIDSAAANILYIVTIP